MFQINDVLIYGTQGVCKIVDIVEKTISGAKKRYYVLKPIDDRSATIYAPTDNEIVMKKMRRLLSTEEINALIDSMPDEDTVWIANNSERKELYKRIIISGDHLELIKMIKAIYTHKQERKAAGKRLHISDLNFFKDAEQILYHEFQYVLNLSSKDDLMAYILNRISNKELFQ